MPARHLDARLFDKLLRGDVDSITPDEARELAWHLMESCSDCGSVVDTDWALSDADDDADVARTIQAHSSPEPLSEGASDSGVEAVFERVGERVKATMAKIREYSGNAPHLAEDFMRHPAPRQRLLALNDRRLHTLPVAELLLDEAWKIGLDKPSEAEALAELILEIVDRIEVEGLTESVLQDVRARAWGFRGNFRRIASDYRGANEAFETAWGLLEQGSGDLLERARLLTLESTLCRHQNRQNRAAELLDEAIRIYRALDESHLLGRTMVNQALLLYELGEAGRAIDVLRVAQGLIDPQREPHLARVAQQNLVVYLSGIGSYEEAMAMIPSLRHKLVAEGTRTELLRLRWLEGKIHLGLGNEARGEAAYLEVRRGMLELEFAKDVALISLELAALYMRQRRTGEIRELAAQMFPIFQSRDLHQQAIAALLLFQRAVEMDTLTLRMVEEVADVVRRSQERPRPRTPEPS